MISETSLRIVFLVQQIGSVLQIFPFEATWIKNPGQYPEPKITLKSSKLWKILVLINISLIVLILLTRLFLVLLNGTIIHFLILMLLISTFSFTILMQIFYMYFSEEMQLLVTEIINFNRFRKYINAVIN